MLGGKTLTWACLVLLVCLAAFVSLGCGLTRAVDYRLPGSTIQPLGYAATNRQREFGQTFCATLAHVDVSGAFAPCSQWIEGAPATAPPATAPIPANLGVLVVAGILGQCFESSGLHVFEQGIAHLRDDHGLRVHEVRVSGLGSSEANAVQIEAFLQRTPGEFIAVGYSKGISDLMVAVQTGALARSRIKALVSVAGTVAGSRLADLPSDAALDGIERAIRRAGAGKCDVQDAGGIRSLRRDVRYAFLQKWMPPADLRTFSIVGVTTREQTSSVLWPLWDQVHYYSADEDSQVIAEEGILPGAAFLGVARGDHWAVALPFSEAGNTLVNRNRFPRTALLEALIRIVHGT
jgi:hypothetical protein